MNSLSWFLYAADVVYASSFLISAFGVILLVLPPIVFVVRLEYGLPNPLKPYYVCLSLAIFLLLLSAIFPSKDTMYAIAASELGQKAVESEIGGKALKAIEQWIDSQVKK